MLRFAPIAAALALSILPAHADESGLSGTVGVTSDYLFRGASQTRGRPALQGGMRYDHGTGLYASGWTSNVDYGADYADVDREYDVAVGFARTFGGVSVDLSHARYMYPGADPNGSLDYSEWLLSAGLGERWSASLGWSGDAYATGTSGSYVQIAYTHPVTDAVALRAAVGDVRFDSALADYRHAEVGASWSHGNWEARLTWHTTSDAARENFGDETARNRVEAAVELGF